MKITKLEDQVWVFFHLSSLPQPQFKARLIHSKPYTNSYNAYLEHQTLAAMPVDDPKLRLRQSKRGGREEQPVVTKISTKRKSCESDCTCDHDKDHHVGHRHHEQPPSSRGVNAEVTQEQSGTTGGDQIVFVDQLADLNKIHDDKVQLAIWRQKSALDFVTTISDPSIAPEDLPAFEGMVLPEEGQVARVIKKHIWVPYKLRSHEKRKRALDEKGIDQLVDQVEQLVQVFAKVSKDAGFLDEGEGQCPFVYVKLHVIEDNGCAFWHQDCVPFRMVSTYRGPCTEWVPPAFSKETLERRQFNSKHAQSLTHCDVALFKGRGDTDEDDEFFDQPGIVHRSPRTTEGSGINRLVLVLDIPQEGWHF